MSSTTNVKELIWTPMDSLERLASEKEWMFNGGNDDTSHIEIEGNFCNFNFVFDWKKESNMLQIVSHFTCPFLSENLPAVYHFLALMNNHLDFGFFNIDPESHIPFFSYTVFLNNDKSIDLEKIENITDIAVKEGEKFFIAISFMTEKNMSPEKAIENAMLFDNEGKA